MSSNIKVQGAESLIKKLDRIGKKDSKKAMRKGTRAGAKVLQSAIKDNAPIRTGNLQQSIKVRATKGKKGWVGNTVVLKSKDADGFYGSFIELGWTAAGGGTYTHGLHFMRDAAKAVGMNAIHRAQLIIAEEIEKLAKQG